MADDPSVPIRADPGGINIEHAVKLIASGSKIRLTKKSGYEVPETFSTIKPAKR